MRNLRRYGLLFCVSTVVVIGCDDPEIIPSGNLSRPSALSYIAHDEQRGDLLIADAEAQGVRVLQLLDDPLQGGSSLKNDRQSFARSPSLAFPLVIPAPRHPTHVVSSGDNAFALSVVDSTIHVLDVKASDFAGSTVSGSVDTYRTLASLKLEQAEFRGAFPVALRAKGSDVFVLFDRPGTQDSLLGQLKLDASSGTWSIASVKTATLAVSSPRDFILRDESETVAVVGGAASSSVAIVGLTDDAGFDSPRYIDAGGPTHRLVDAEESGVVILRLDRPALVLLETNNGVLRRSDRRFDNDEGIRSPYMSRADSDALLLDADLYGRIDLPSPAVAGAFGRLDNLKPGFSGVAVSDEMRTACTGEKTEGNICSYLNTNGEELTGRCGFDGDELACLFAGHVPNVIRSSDRDADGFAPIVYIVLVDGRDAFLAGSPLRLVRASNSFVERVEALRTNSIEIDECEQIQAASSCEDRQTKILCSAAAELSSIPAEGCAGVVSQASACAPSVLSREFETATSFRVEYRGNLFTSEEFTLSLSTTSTTEAELVLGSSEAFSSSLFQVRLGDLVDIQLERPVTDLQSCADLDEPALVAALAELEANVFSVSFLANSNQTVTLQLGEDETLNKLLACGIVFTGRRVEIYPSDEIMILAELSDSASERSGKVHAREPIQTSSTGAAFVDLDSILRLNIRSDEGFSVGSSCERKEIQPSCSSDSECSVGLCVQSPVQNRTGQTCAGFCQDGQKETKRVCSGFRFEVSPSVMNSNPVTSCPATTQGILIAAPEDTTFVPERKSWFTSVPGSRALRETILTIDSYLTCAIYR